MVPREHGAYAELLFPIATVLLGGLPTAPTWLLAVAVVASFLANEPLLVLLGERGSRAKRRASDRAKRALLIFVLLALCAGIAGFVLSPRGVRIAIGLPLLLGGGLVLTAVQGLERSMFGEALAAAALSSVAIPLGLSAGLRPTAAVAVTLIWLVASLLGTSIVRLTIARTKSKTEEAQIKVAFKRAMLIGVCLVVIVVGVGAPFGSRTGLWVLAAAVPVAVVVLVMAALRPTTRRLRLMGWSLVAANFCSLIAVVITLKIIQDFEAVEPTLPFPMF
ncbi:MAG: YwiC-like family protein [Polyangiales bacterium]